MPFAVSLVVHGGVFAWVASGPIREKPDSLYQQIIAPHESKLIWYDFRKKLPDVSPADTPTASRRPRAEVKIASQEIVAGAETAPRARQFIWQPAPKLELQQDLRSPNLLAFNAPHVDAPHVEPPPKPKLFVPPTEAPPPVAANPKLDALPDIQAERAVTASPLGNLLGVQPARPKPRAFVAPRAGQAVAASTPALPAPPSVEAAMNVGAAPLLRGETPRPTRRAFVPPTRSAKPSAFGAALTEAPALPADSTAGVSIAIVGLNPSATTVPLPEGSRNTQLSGGPTPHATGGSGGAVEGAGLVVPGLLIRGGAPADTKPVLVPNGAPTSPQNLRAAVRANIPDSSIAGPHPAAVRVSNVPDPSFAGRAIYGMTVQMPNVTSYSGSWMIWFAERLQMAGRMGALSPPVPLRKVDPKYIASAVEDRVEGKVRLAAVIRTDGHVDSVKLLLPLDDRLDQSAQEAIDKWRFEPAHRNGQPVEVDAVIEIPFHLAPQAAR